MKKKRNVNFLKIGVLLFSISLLLWNCEKSEDLIIPQSDNQIEVIKKKFEEEFNQQAYPYLKAPLWEAISSSTFNGEEYFEIPFDKLDRINFQKSTRLNTHKLVAKRVNNELQLNIVFFSIPIKSGKFIDHVSLDDLELKSGFISFFDLDKNAVDLYRYSKGKKFRNDYKIKSKNQNNKLLARMPQEGENCIETTVDHFTRTCWSVDDVSWCSAWEFSYSYTYSTCDGGGGGGGNSYSETPPECSQPGYFKNDEGICVDGSFIVDNPDNPINDIVEFLKCFDLSKSASISVYVSEPNPGTGDTHNGTAVGHTFISLGQGAEMRTFGFYPVSDYIYPVVNNSGDSVLGDDGVVNQGFSASISKTITASQLAQIIDKTKNYKKRYNLNTYNCTDFAIEMGNLGGLNLPDAFGSWPGGGGSNPGTLGEHLRGLNPSNNNLNTIGGSAPKTNKGC
jgi:hypothetical protein